MTGYIYKFTNRINDKVYIGQTYNLQTRLNSHKSKALNTKNKFYNAIRKYGWENFELSILSTITANTKEELSSLLDKLEIEYIKQYNSYKSGYNSTLGGHSKRGYKLSEEFSEKCKSRTYSDDTRKKMSISAKNRIISEETRLKLRNSAIKRNFSKYRELTTSSRNKAIKRALGVPVLQLDVNFNIINRFDSISDAIKYIKNSISPNLTLVGIRKGLLRHCTDETKKLLYKGFIWKYDR